MKLLIGIGILYVMYVFRKDIDFKQWYKKYRYMLQVIYTPMSWVQNYKYSMTWDIKLNELMEKYTFKRVNRAEVTLKDYMIWIENHPYASFTHNDVRPKRCTIFKAYDKLQRDIHEGEEL